MGWTVELEEELKRLWTEGLPTGEIGKILNVTKNAVVGKAHRLGLESRPSPIKRASKEKTAKPAVKTEKKAPVDKKEKDITIEVEKKTVAAPEPVVTSTTKKSEGALIKGKHYTVADLTSTSCRWPIGDPKDEDFHFCGKPALPDRPYCEEHCAEAYVSAKSLR